MQKEILSVAKKAISGQAKGVKELGESLGEDFVKTIHILSKMKGRLIVSGIGKSALVGKKIVGTLNSTGTSAMFMHAADAIHGDLGMICEDDVVMILSKSGESPEIKFLIPLVKSLGVPTIGISMNAHSFLVSSADYPLLIPMQKEADPNNLAPTTSSTLQMVLGDAIAICLLEEKGFDREDFAKLHPGGFLGKQLSLRVSDLLQDAKVPRVSPEDPISKVIVEISSKMLGASAVIQAEEVVGIITDGDLRRMLEKDIDFSRVKAVDIMSSSPLRIEYEEFAVEALRKMREKQVSQLIVMQGKIYKGMLHLHAILREGIV